MVDMYRGPEAVLQPAVYRVRGTPLGPADLLAQQGWDDAMAVTWGPDGFATTFRAVWTPEGLCVRWDAQDRAPWATRTQRDDCLWETEVVEVFLDPDTVAAKTTRNSRSRRPTWCATCISSDSLQSGACT